MKDGSGMHPVRKINCELNKKVICADDTLSLWDRQNIYGMAKNSGYYIGWDDTQVPERKLHDQHLFCGVNLDLFSGYIKKFKKVPEVAEELQNLEIVKGIINLSVPTNVNYVHAHPEKKVLLYYVNLEWPEGGHGETQFYSENLKEIQYTCPYTPGRILVFDGSIPHTIRPQSNAGPKFRFTLTFLYN